MKFQITVIGLLFLTAAVLGYNAWTDTVKECTKPGNLCETCDTLVSCIEENGTFSKRFLENCSDHDQICVHGNCTSDPDPFCDGTADLEFPCTHVGIFPHPFYCNKFVLCVNDGKKLTPYLNDCPEGFQYNLATDLCDTPLEGAECPEDVFPVPLCGDVVGQTAAMDNKPAMYYLCQQYSATNEVIYPYLYLCKGSDTYNDHKCE